MSIADTSIDAYDEHRESGRLGEQQRRLMEWLHLNPGEYTRSELAKRTGIRLSSICGRVNELIELGYLEEAGRRECSETGRSAHPIRIRLPKVMQQMDLLGESA